MNFLSKIYENCSSSPLILKLGAIAVELEQREETNKHCGAGEEGWVGVETNPADTACYSAETDFKHCTGLVSQSINHF